LLAKPTVDRLERELEGKARVVRLSAFDEVGQEMARRYDVRGVPTFLVFDGQGNLIGRDVGMPDHDKIKALVVSS
jgi:thioredoxin-related protein